MTQAFQTALLCGCGRADIHAQGRCSSCYFAWKRSELHFGGLRYRILTRDKWQCLCGELDSSQIVVHHRRPGVHRERYLLSLCRACHARVHRTYRPLYGFPEFLRDLWREQNRDLAEQYELALNTASFDQVGHISQPTLFEAA